MGVTLTGESRMRLDKHLDAVEAALAAAGNWREQRRGVVDDLEAQILDMLAARSKAPTLEDVEAVLATLDSPAAYGSEGEKGASVGASALATRVAVRTRKAAKRRNFMRSSVLVALIVCGTLLVMTPAIADYFTRRNFMEYAASMAARATLPDRLHLNFDAGPMEGVRRLGFWLTGSVAIGCGIIGGFVAFARLEAGAVETSGEHRGSWIKEKVMAVTMGSEAQARLDKHLDAVEQVLAAAGNTREQRRGVVDDLEAQILDMLAAGRKRRRWRMWRRCWARWIRRRRMGLRRQA